MRTRLGGLFVVASLGLVLNLLLQADEPQSLTVFPEPVNTEPDGPVKALPPHEAARGFRVPDGFRVSVFAAEPDVQNPIAMAWDGRGRLWVAENYTYADRTKKFDFSLRDCVLIFEDVDGDGRHDKRTVFTDDVQMLTSIEVGAGGVWLMCPPQLLFVPDRDGDDKPDGAPLVMLDGFAPSTDNYHTFANGLKWGPDGWLYGRCGASSPGRIGAPGTPDAQRVPLNGGIWRYRPESAEGGVRKAEQKEAASHSELRTPNSTLVEVLSHGTTNPWGMDWNEHGEAFFINTVNGHLWQVIPGAHYKRPHSEDPNPYVYEMIDTHADHYHWDTGKDWSDSRNVSGEHDRLGGGHAHSGATIYLGDNWPKEYRGRLLTLNLHGRRINVERLEREGSGYVARHEPDILHAADPWFRGIDLSYGPDGAVYILDWSDTGECHEHTGVHRTSGRIYRVAHGSAPRQPLLDLTKLGSGELIALHRHPNEWFVRQARRVLVNRPPLDVTPLRSMFENDRDVIIRLRAMWTLFSIGELRDDVLLAKLRDPDEHVRAWIVRLLTDRWPLDTIFGEPHPFAVAPKDQVVRELIRLAKEDESGLVRLVLSSTLQRLPVERRLELAAPLAARDEDADDHNLPLMVWYGLMPVAKARPEALAKFAVECRFPTTRRLMARRLAEMIDQQPLGVDALLTAVRSTDQPPEKPGISESAELPDVLAGLTEGFAGRHKVKTPAGWNAIAARVATSDNAKLRERVRDLSVLFGDGRALDEVKRVALDGKADMASRKAALQTLIDARPDDLRAVCEKLLAVRSLNTVALRGLAQFDDPALGEKLATSYRGFYPAERPAVIETLCSRPSFAKALLDQIALGKIPRTELSAVQARQIRSFGNETLTKHLTDVWGELRDSPDDKRQLIDKLKSQLTPDVLSHADKSAGRAVFNKVCANCHRLYGHGGQIGPDLTGAGRQNLDYVLINLVDPSAAVGADYRMSVVVLNDGRVLNGIVASKTDRTLTLQTAKDRLTIDRSEIEELQPSSLSLMPDGQLPTLTDDQIRDLVGYLMHPTQVPLAETAP